MFLVKEACDCQHFFRSLDGLQDQVALQTPQLKKNSQETEFVKLKCKEYAKINKELEVQFISQLHVLTTLNNSSILICDQYFCLLFNMIIVYFSLKWRRQKQSGFEPRIGTLHCVHWQDTRLSQCLSPPRCINRLNAGGNHVMDQHPIQGGVEIFLVNSCYRNWDKLQSSGLLDHMQTLPFTSLS